MQMVSGYPKAEKAEKQTGTSKARQTGGAAAEATWQVKYREGGAERLQEARRSLQTGESVLAEVEESLARLEEIAEEASGEGSDIKSLEAELKEISRELQRIIESGPFEGIERVLLSLEGDISQEAYKAAEYLGAVISGSELTEPIDAAQVVEGLRQLLEALSGGKTPDEAIEALTSGKYTSLADFQEQVSNGTAPGFQDFQTVLLTGGSLSDMPSILAMLMEGGGMGDFDLLMGLLASLESSMAGQAELPGAAVTPESAPPQPQALETESPPQLETREFAGTQVTGSDLSAASFEPKTDVLTLAGKTEYALHGQGQESPAIWLTSPGTVKLQQVDSPLLTVDSAQAHVEFKGENTLAQIQLKDGTVLTLEGGGVLHIGSLRGRESSALRLTGGSVEMPEEAGTTVPVVVDGPVSLLAAKNLIVRNAQGETLTPFDVLWKTLLPEWTAINAMEIDGRQGPLNRMKGAQPEAVRLWLLKGNDSQGYPAHTVVLHGRDQAGRLQTRYVYLRWSLQTGSFEVLPLYPNPFTVTGGEQDVDWHYEEENCTLHILTSQVKAIAGGTGEDINQLPFSGRIALADRIGQVELTLDGVECRVNSGRAFSLGRGNNVTLLLRSGTHNVFESGAGCAGISLGVGTSLRIDQAPGAKGPPGTLDAMGGPGCAGIGQDSGVSQQLAGPILICGGSVTATGSRTGARASLTPKPPAPASSAAEAAAALPKFRMSAQSLQLDALDISTRETARTTAGILAKDRRKVGQMQKAYGAMYGRLEQKMGRLRDSGEADALLWDMRQSLEQSSVAEYSQWLADDIGQLLW